MPATENICNCVYARSSHEQKWLFFFRGKRYLAFPGDLFDAACTGNHCPITNAEGFFPVWYPFHISSFSIEFKFRLDEERAFTYNLHMVSDNMTKYRIESLRYFYLQKWRMPSFSEMGELFGLKSKNAVSKVVDKLKILGVVEKDEKGKLIPGSLLCSLKLLGTVEAGLPSRAEEELAEAISLDNLLIQNQENSFLLKVSGDSMSEAGILPGDMVIVDKGRDPKNEDVVIAEVDGEWTMKYFRKEGKRIELIPANKKYKTIYPKNELKITGVVAAVIRKY